MPILVARQGKLRVLHPVNKAGEDVRLIEARQRALELRREGMSYRQIAAIMKVYAHTAYGYVQAELNDLRDQTLEDTEALRDIELQRADEFLRSLGAGIRAGDPQSIGVAIKVMERRAKLLGLDAPERKTVTHQVISPEDAAKLSDEELLARMKHLTSMAAAALAPGNPALAALDGEIVDSALLDPDNSDAAIEHEASLPPAKVSIDVRQFMSPPRQGPYSAREGVLSGVAPAAEFEDAAE